MEATLENTKKEDKELRKKKRAKRRARRERRRRKRLAASMTWQQKFERAQKLKTAIRCMLRAEDQHMVYLRLEKQFAELAEEADKEIEGAAASETPERVAELTRMREKCGELAGECRASAVELEPQLPAEKEEDSRTVTRTARDRDSENKEKKKGSGKWVLTGLAVIIVTVVLAFRFEPGRYVVAHIEKICGFKDEAVKMFNSISGYKDSGKQAALIEQDILRGTRTGGIVAFGGRDYIILEKKKDAVLIIAGESEDSMPYNDTEKGVTWENCGARMALNGGYLNENFKESERELILEREVKAPVETNGASAGNDTVDKVFILSSGQYRKYKRRLGSKGNNIRLRNPGKEAYTTKFVSCQGDIVNYGYPVNGTGALIRPAMWVSTVFPGE